MPKKQILVGTYNVLADDYIKNGDYRHATANMNKGGRTNGLVNFIAGLGADLIGLQEVEQPLIDALVARDQWQEPFWSQKQGSSDGCLTLVKKHITVNDFSTHYFSDGSGHVVQELVIGETLVGNTHIDWELRARQLRELLARTDGSALLLGDFNIRPEEPERDLIPAKGFNNVWGDKPTAAGQQRLTSWRSVVWPQLATQLT